MSCPSYPRAGAGRARGSSSPGRGSFLPKTDQRAGDIPVFGGNGVNGYHDQALLTTPTIVIGRVGANCGNLHLTEGPAWITDNAIFAAAGTDQAVLPYWRMVMSLQHLNANAGGTGQPYVNQRHLNELAIPLPPQAEQVRISAVRRQLRWDTDGLNLRDTHAVQERQDTLFGFDQQAAVDAHPSPQRLP
ncbi:MAG: restriction endonuclease subunit S, partial [Candidatus Eisenbacteria bacterium]|nr:restriction endonuclease subunit S [Candidatus Eisenbacteria bacterium]